MAVVIVKDGRVHAVEGFGVRAPGEGGKQGPAVTPETMFYIASMTKTYLATAVCVLADEGKLSLDDPVAKHLPRFDLADGPGRADGEITIRDLLCHGQGLENHLMGLLDAFTGEITEERYYHWLSRARARGRLAYANTHYTLLGRVVEVASGKRWQEFVEERVLAPAGLTRTVTTASRLYGDADCAIPMELVGGEWRACRLRKTDRTMHSAGGMGASASDVGRWLLVHLNDGEIEGRRVVSEERAREMRRLHAAQDRKQGSIRVMAGYGLAWQVGSFHGTPLAAHGGDYAGTAFYCAMLPEKKSGFAVLMNAGGAALGLQDVIAVDMLDRLMDGDERLDVLEAYRGRLAEHRQRAATRRAERGAELARAHELTRPASAYAGRFVSADLGTMTVSAEGERLKIVLGECEMDVTAAGADALRVLGPTLERAVVSFEVTPEGDVAAAVLDIPGIEKQRFGR